jgi:hypothetical protein
VTYCTRKRKRNQQLLKVLRYLYVEIKAVADNCIFEGLKEAKPKPEKKQQEKSDFEMFLSFDEFLVINQSSYLCIF